MTIRDLFQADYEAVEADLERQRQEQEAEEKATALKEGQGVALALRWLGIECPEPTGRDVEVDGYTFNLRNSPTISDKQVLFQLHISKSYPCDDYEPNGVAWTWRDLTVRESQPISEAARRKIGYQLICELQTIDNAVVQYTQRYQKMLEARTSGQFNISNVPERGETPTAERLAELIREIANEGY